MADLSKLSTDDLMALKAGDLSKVSDAGLMALKTPESAPVAQNLSPTLKEGLTDVLSKERFPTAAKFMGGVGSAFDSAALRAKQIFSSLTPEDNARLSDNQALSDVSGGAGLAGEVAGGIAMTGAPAASLYRGATALAAKALPAAVAPAIGGAVSGGTVAGLTQPVTGDQTTLGNVGIGMAGGALGDTLARGAARVAQPVLQSPAVRTLLDNGIVPTVGRAAGGFMKDMESKLNSTFGLGDIIKSATNRSANELNLAGMRTVDPVATKIGREGMESAQKVADDAYSTVMAKFSVTPDQKFVAAAKRIANEPSRLLTEEQRRQIVGLVNDRILDPAARGGNPAIPGELFKQIDSELGAQASGYMKDPSQSGKNFGNALFKIQTEWRDLVERNAPKAVADELREANRKWANLTILERAMAKSNADGFNANQLQQAVKESDPSIRKRAFAAGNARGQELSDAAKTVMGGGYPDSGTVGRYAVQGILGGIGAAAGGYQHGYEGAGAGAGAGLAVPLALAAMASPAYSRMGARYLIGDLAPRLQQGASAAIRSTAPAAVVAGEQIAESRKQKRVSR